MSGKQRAVLWLGVLLIGLNLVSKWGELKSVIFSSGNSSSGSGGGFHLPTVLPPVFVNQGGNAQTTPSNNKVTLV